MASMNDKDYYAVLGVEKDATTAEIRKAFQQKARKLHPDVNKAPDAEEKFKEVSEAYAVLSDEEKRKRYDAMRSGNPFAGSYGSSPAGAGGRGYYTGGGPYSWGPFGGSYTSTTRRSSRAYNPKAGADFTMDVDLSAEEAKSGCKRGFTYQHYVSCDVCHGAGSVESEHSQTCPTCAGRGNIEIDLGSIFGIGVMQMTCPECEGTGRVVANPCTSCGGSGRTLSASEVVVDIPANSHDGDEVRVKGVGNAGTNGSSAGDFVARVCVASERLTAAQANGFYLIGFVVPFIVVGLLSGGLASIGLFVVLACVFGAVVIIKDGVKFCSGWWRHAGAALGNGASSGVTFAILFFLLFSCQGLGARGYMGGAGW